MIWYDTKSLETKVLQVKHGLDRWVACHPPRLGRGVVQVLEGPLPSPPKLIREILKVDQTTQVTSDAFEHLEYLVITVTDPKFWNQIKADIQNIVVTELPEESLQKE